jgi:uncharacterized protein YbjT (DUF2867 family)
MILITGAAGTVGSQLVRILTDNGIPIRAGVHSRPLDMDGVESYRIDYEKPETLKPALQGVQKVFLVLPITFDGEAMANAGRVMVEAALVSGVQHIVKLSAYGAGDEGYTHARWHRRVERIIENSRLDWTFLRPNAFMQTLLEGWAESIRKEGRFYDAVEGRSYAPIDARDIARMAAQTLNEPGHKGKAYELTGPEALSWDEAADTLSRVLGRTIHYVRISDEELRQSLLDEGYSKEMADAWIDVNRYTQRVPSTVTSSVKDITGREPVSFEQFCREYAAARISFST